MNEPLRELGEVRAIDSHTEGEPTRIVIGGLPPLHGRTLAECRDELRSQWDHLRTGILLEPRGHDAIVAALLLPPVDSSADTGVIFCNDDGYLGMCGHGSIGVAAALVAEGRIAAREGETPVTLETPVGLVPCVVTVTDGRPVSVRIRNVPSFATHLDTRCEVPGLGEITVDVAWGGNWFAFVRAQDLGITVERERLPELMSLAMTIRTALADCGIRGVHPEDPSSCGAVDHVKIWQKREQGDGTRDLTLCPGRAYDRSPCGTGTAAKLAVLHARGTLGPGQKFVGESILGTCFDTQIVETTTIGSHDAVMVEIEGSAYITGHQRFVFDSHDPLRHGIR